MEKLLIVGDSFAADWGSKTPVPGWSNLISQHYQTTNLAQAGCGQYKIYRQLHSVEYKNFDYILIWHTSPYRVHVLQNSIHNGDVLHHNADLIYSDVEHHAKTDQSLRPIVDWFKTYFDPTHAEFVYGLICDRMLDDLAGFQGEIIHCICQDSYYPKLKRQKNFLNFNYLFSPGSCDRANHFDKSGNETIYQIIKVLLEKSKR